MAQIETWIRTDIKKPIEVQVLKGNVFSADNMANLIGVEVYDNGELYTLSGTVTASIIRGDGGTVTASGSFSGNKASVVLPAAAYVYPGIITVVIKVTSGSVVTTIGAVVATVYRSSTDTIVDPGTVIPNIEELIAEIEAAIASIPADYSSLWTSLAYTFSTSTTYKVGQYVTYNGKLYRFTTAHPAGSWNSAHVTAVAVGSDLYVLSGMTEKNQPLLPEEMVGSSCNAFTEPNVFFVSSVGGVLIVPDFPFNAPGWLRITVTNSNLIVQEAYPYYFDRTPYLMMRIKQLGTWTNWRRIPLDVDGSPVFEHDMVDSVTVTSETFDGITLTQVKKWKYHLQGTTTATSFYNLFYDYSNIPEGVKAGETIIPYCSSEKVSLQIFAYVNGSFSLLGDIAEKNKNNFGKLVIPANATGFLFRLSYTAGTVLDEDVDIHIWSGSISSIIDKIKNDDTAFITDFSNENTSSCDDVTTNGVVFVSNSGGAHTSLFDFPLAGPGWLFTSCYRALRYQMAFPYNTNENIKYRNSFIDGTFTQWVDIGSGSTTTTIVQEVSRDTYNNDYDITVTPEITADTNGWLQAVDTNTADETGKTDMTSAIMAMLNSTGYCHLGPGIFYVSGNIDMPADSLLEGCGKQTIIRLLQSVTSGYIVRMHTRSTVRNVCFSGGYAAGDISDGNIGGRKGINYIGNRDGQSTGVTPTTCTCCMIDGCWFENLDSGFYGYNAGGGLQEGVICNNCYFTRCKAGINIDYWTEYSKFTNCITFQCYYACINNGGNNVFTACTFHGVIGFLIDNSSGTKANSAHGTVNGCTFNHIDNMNHPETLGNGYGVKVINITAGFVFANCQFWYGKAYVERSLGVQFSDCEFGGYPTIETSGSGTVFFDGCIFQSAPTTSISSPTKFDNCYTYAGAAVTA